MTIEIYPVTQDNVETAIDVAVKISGERERKAITQEFNAAVGYKKEIKGVRKDLYITSSRYFLIYKDGEAAGMAGYYRIKGRPEDAWLGWMGVDQKCRGMGLGEILVREAFNCAAARFPRIKTFRIWTTLESEYDAARKLYKNMGFLEECYNPQAADAGRMIMVFSKRADPAAATIEEKDADSWRNASYPIDCDKYTIPDLNKKLGLR